MRKLSYKCSSDCDVYVCEGALEKSLFNELLQGANRVAIFYSNRVCSEFIGQIKSLLKSFNQDVFECEITDGENAKTLENATKLANFLHSNSFNRNDLILNVGGGTVCDLGAFVASIYKRGISYVNVPTTLLCAVDACIGGKTAIDVNGIKNLLGTIKQPKSVLIYTSIINDLPQEIFNGGISEIVKYGVIKPEFGEFLIAYGDLNAIKQNIVEIIYRCLAIKAEFVTADEFDYGVRRQLNAGHTTAHAIEYASEFELNHAQAVALGLVAEARLARLLNLISNERYARLKTLFELLPKSEKYALNLNKVIHAMQSDKKNVSDKITFILPSETGVTEFYLRQNELVNLLEI